MRASPVTYPTSTGIICPMTSFFLIGPMGSGKTSVGRQLAKRLKLPFHDSDREIEARCGVDIPTIFEYEGEEGFRQREEAVLDELTQLPDIVLATGGGSILRKNNRQVLSERGYVILLSVTLDEQLRRISLNSNRPLLQTPDPAATLRKLRDERASLYQATADYEISTDSSKMQNLINRLLRHLRAEGLAPAPKSRRSSRNSSNAGGKNNQSTLEPRSRDGSIPSQKDRGSRSGRQTRAGSSECKQSQDQRTRGQQNQTQLTQDKPL